MNKLLELQLNVWRLTGTINRLPSRRDAHPRMKIPS